MILLNSFVPFQTLQGPLDDGSVLKEVSDGTNTIGALFTTEAVEEWRKYVLIHLL